MLENTDEHGRLKDLRCHDGFLVAVELLGGHAIKLKFRRNDGTKPEIELEGVQYFSVDRFREGNIVDSAYVWLASEAPQNQRKAAASSFSFDESNLDRKSELDADKLFVIDSSYGATVYALVREVQLLEGS